MGLGNGRLPQAQGPGEDVVHAGRQAGIYRRAGNVEKQEMKGNEEMRL